MNFEEFNRDTIENKDIKWLSDMGVYKIDDTKRAEINLNDFNYKDHYTGYTVRIVNKDNGTISIHDFMFSEYLRADASDHPNRDCVDKLYAWYHNGDVRWYILNPVSTKPIEKAIFDYIELYK